MFYQRCFGGIVQFEEFEEDLGVYLETPVIIGSLISERIILFGSDLIHDEGRKVGNHLSIFLPCKNVEERTTVLNLLTPYEKCLADQDYPEQRLVEVTDFYNVSWVLGL